ncbi:hypothetical protein GE061_000807 [Apolygus lucorum]|uniref:Uncharacterized protein n=1 Tax=Apolygus lucorum TaxID=248454 RepID=A0A8S9YAC3_APOLU|nr:hypothetical protein GE061_000807 [Apolygus lucorum]
MKQFLSVVSILFIVQGIKSGEKYGSVIILSSSNATDVQSGPDIYIVKNVDDALELICMSNNSRSVVWVLPNIYRTEPRILMELMEVSKLTLNIC